MEALGRNQYENANFLSFPTPLIRAPHSSKGILRSMNGTLSVELNGGSESLSIAPGTEVDVLLWDVSSAGQLEQIAHMQGISVEDAAQGYSARGALHASGRDSAATGVNAPFASRISYSA